MENHISRVNDAVLEFVDNKDLQCADCAYCMERSTTECEKYLKKPGYVFYGTKPCPQYRKRGGA